MKIATARQRIVAHRLLSTALLLGCMLFVILGALKAVYSVADAQVLGVPAVNDMIRQGIYFLYSHTSFFAWGWDLAPVPQLKAINVPGNLAWVSLLCCAALSRVIWTSASYLSRRIRRVFQRVEELGWEQELLSRPGEEPPLKPDVRQLNIVLEWKEQWHKRPTGILLFLLALGCALQWANLKFALLP